MKTERTSLNSVEHHSEKKTSNNEEKFSSLLFLFLVASFYATYFPPKLWKKQNLEAYVVLFWTLFIKD